MPSFLLLVAFQAPVAAAIGVITNLLSTGAAFGIAKWIFQDGHLAGLLGFQPQGFLDAWAPVFFFAMIFAISMDYTVFLLSSTKEHWDKEGDAHRAMVGGLAHSGRVILAAGAVMVAVFFTFALSGPLPPKEMGVILGIAVLLDAFLVRLLLVPVLLRVAGPYRLACAELAGSRAAGHLRRPRHGNSLQKSNPAGGQAGAGVDSNGGCADSRRTPECFAPPLIWYAGRGGRWSKRGCRERGVAARARGRAGCPRRPRSAPRGTGIALLVEGAAGSARRECWRGRSRREETGRLVRTARAESSSARPRSGRAAAAGAGNRAGCRGGALAIALRQRRPSLIAFGESESP